MSSARGAQRALARRENPGEGMHRFAKGLRSRQTRAEQLLWQLLRNRQLARWKFRRQHPIGRYIVDFASLDAKLVIEVDGDTHYSDAAQARDLIRTKAIEQCGYLVVRVSNIDIYDNIDGVVEMIHRTLDPKRQI
ncbi:endonuclease domain-containing protein [Variibacter gotjawalensis]|uniref:endonuclease domain-containing protein n=1 Tax=Variibacter gotjawalensis TaxID=1333996 RepID=UPI0010D11EA6|nr:endonuclease domain-containing protein [Variibacter gotjawalensis]NIK48960.1 very-short-patch-repair endonuclease [Variibacter gotjawalensis]RZS50816.1 very-short-patch-repair endonuclease [Variibacter gotjawalensis]